MLPCDLFTAQAVFLCTAGLDLGRFHVVWDWVEPLSTAARRDATAAFSNVASGHRRVTSGGSLLGERSGVARVGAENSITGVQPEHDRVSAPYAPSRKGGMRPARARRSPQSRTRNRQPGLRAVSADADYGACSFYPRRHRRHGPGGRELVLPRRRDCPGSRRDDAGAVHLERGTNPEPSGRLRHRGCPSGFWGASRIPRTDSEC